ncbi:MAG: NHL repeat-containing protein [Armatimonadota bacterium]
MIQDALQHFELACTPGLQLFYILSHPYAPPLAGAPAQVFVGEWTGSDRGADIGVWEVESGRWQVIPFDGFQITSHLFVDPYRPVLYLSAPQHLYEIDRKTLQSRVICELPRQYTADVTRDGKVWFALTRSLHCVDPFTGACTRYPDVTPDEYFYREGTHMVLGAGLDGRVWTYQGPIPCLAVFDPATQTSKVVWGQLEKPPEGIYRPGAGAPVAIGDLIWAGGLFVDARTDELVEPPFKPGRSNDDDGYALLMRGTWHRTPTAELDRHGKALVVQRKTVGWLEVKSGQFEPIGAFPDDFATPPSARGWSLHGEHTLLSADKCNLITIDLQAKKHYRVEMDFQPVHAQSMFEWTVGPDNKFYGSGFSHDLWQVDQQGTMHDFGNVVNIRGGELFGFTNWQQKLFIISYTGSVLTRVDVSRPADHWGPTVADNPHHIIDLLQFSEGQHRPRGVGVTPRGHLYYISCADYCTRREGAMVIVDAETEEVLKIVDPLLPGEQLFTLAISSTYPEVYIGTSEGSFVVWDTEKWEIKKIIRFSPRDERDGEMTSAEIKIGGTRFMAAAGNRVMGNRFGGEFDAFTYHADTGEMEGPAPHPLGKLFGVWSWRRRDSLLLYINGNLYESTEDGQIRLLYPEPLPGFAVREGTDGRLYISDGMSIFRERKPHIERL